MTYRTIASRGLRVRLSLGRRQERGALQPIVPQPAVTLSGARFPRYPRQNTARLMPVSWHKYSIPTALASVTAAIPELALVLSEHTL